MKNPLPNEELKLKLAKRLFYSEHPRSDWLLFPSYSQAVVQSRYTQMAAAVIWECYSERERLITEDGR